MGLLVVVACVLGCGFSAQERTAIDFGRRLVPWATFVFALVQILWISATIVTMNDGAGGGSGGWSRFMNDFKACLTASEGLLVTVLLASAVFVADQKAAVRAWLPVLADLAEGQDYDSDEDYDSEGEGEGGAAGKGGEPGSGTATGTGDLLQEDDRAAIAEFGSAWRNGPAAPSPPGRKTIGAGRGPWRGVAGGGEAKRPAPDVTARSDMGVNTQTAALSAGLSERLSEGAPLGTDAGSGRQHVRVRNGDRRWERQRQRGPSLDGSAAVSLMVAAEDQLNPYDCAGLSRTSWWAAAIAMFVLAFHHTLNLWTAENQGA